VRVFCVAVSTDAANTDPANEIMGLPFPKSRTVGFTERRRGGSAIRGIEKATYCRSSKQANNI